MAQEEKVEGTAPASGSSRVEPDPSPAAPEAGAKPEGPPTERPAPEPPPSPDERPDPRPTEPEPLPDERTLVTRVLQTLVNHIGIRSRIEVEKQPAGYYANIKTRHSNGLLIGRRGATLRSLQYLARLIVKQDYPDVPPITVDVSGYRQRRENFLRKKATAVARIVLETGREMALDLLTEKEMEVVEETLRPMGGIRVYAVGAGSRKNVIIAPTHHHQ